MTPIYLSKDQLPPQLRHLHTGGRIVVYVTEDVVIPATAGTWSGGTREVYSAVCLASGKAVSITDTFSPPWDAHRQAHLVKLKPGYAVAETGTFCGKNAGLTIFALAQDIAPVLPGPTAAMTPEAAKVLNVICGYKSAYRMQYLRQENLTDAQIERAKDELLRMGYINKQGAATPAGRNARAGIYTNLP